MGTACSKSTRRICTVLLMHILHGHIVFQKYQMYGTFNSHTAWTHLVPKVPDMRYFIKEHTSTLAHLVLKYRTSGSFRTKCVQLLFSLILPSNNFKTSYTKILEQHFFLEELSLLDYIM